MRDYSPNAVSTAYAANGTGPMVYGRYRDRGYEVNPLTARVGTLVPENVSASEAFAIAGLHASGETVIEDTACVQTSYPGFESTLMDILQRNSMRQKRTPVISSLDSRRRRGKSSKK